MIRAGEHPHHVRRHKSDKADRSADRNADTDQHRNGDEHRELRPAHVYADVPRVVLADGKGVQLPRVQAQDRPTDGQRRRQQRRVSVGRALKRAHRPEGDALELVRGERHKDAHGAGNEHGVDHADQDDRIGRERVVEPVRQRQNERQRAKCKQHRHDRRPRKRQRRKIQSERNGDHRSQRCAGRDAERRAVGQRIAQQSLHTGARQRKSGSAECDAQDARHAHTQNDGYGNALRRRAPSQRRAEHGQRLTQRNIDASKTDAETHRRQQRRRQKQIL